MAKQLAVADMHIKLQQAKVLWFQAISEARVDEASAGLPVGVQVVGRSWRDTDVLAAMRAIEADVSGDDGYPATPVAM